MTNRKKLGIMLFVDLVNELLCESGGIGRRARLRGVWATVRVQVPSPAPFLLPDCVKVAQQTLTLFVWVRILVRQPNKKRHPSGCLFLFQL